MELLHDFWLNFSHNLFKPLLLFFYLGFSIPLFRVSFEFPYVIYQGLTMYLLLAIGWHGGEELASISFGSLQQAIGFMVIGFCTNFVIGWAAYAALRSATKLRKIDAATVAGYYGSDSAGTFVTCIGVLSAAGIAYAAYMPVLLAVMEIPGCLVALYLVSRLRNSGIDANGNAPDEVGYDPTAVAERTIASAQHGSNGHSTTRREHAAVGAQARSRQKSGYESESYDTGSGYEGDGTAVDELPPLEEPREEDHRPRKSNDDRKAVKRAAEMALERIEGEDIPPRRAAESIFTTELLHEVFMNPGIYLLFGGILIGFVARLQGAKVTAQGDSLFLNLFQGVLCLFLLEMGITASKRLGDLKKAGWGFIAFALIAPNVFAAFGILVAHTYSYLSGTPFELGTYVLFAVLCGASSYIAVPAVQRLAIPEASPTLPLAASLGLTFSYNVTIGIPLYIVLAKTVMAQLPVA